MTTTTMMMKMTDDIIIVEGEPGKVKKKHMHQDEVVGAFDMIQSFMEDETLPLPLSLSI